MEIRYSLTYRDPPKPLWKKRYGAHWSYGYLNVHMNDSVESINIPHMHNRDWSKFSKWLNKFTTNDKWTLDQLVNFYEENNEPITWLDYNDQTNAQVII